MTVQQNNRPLLAWQCCPWGFQYNFATTHRIFRLVLGWQCSIHAERGTVSLRCAYGVKHMCGETVSSGKKVTCLVQKQSSSAEKTKTCRVKTGRMHMRDSCRTFFLFLLTRLNSPLNCKYVVVVNCKSCNVPLDIHENEKKIYSLTLSSLNIAVL